MRYLGVVSLLATCIYDYVILCHCTLAAALYFEQSSCDELMEFKQIQTRAQPEESLKHNQSCTNMSPTTRPLLLHSVDTARATLRLNLYMLPHEVVTSPHQRVFRHVSVLRGVLRVRIGCFRICAHVRAWYLA